MKVMVRIVNQGSFSAIRIAILKEKAAASRLGVASDGTTTPSSKQALGSHPRKAPAPPSPLRPVTPTVKVTPSTPITPADNLI
ncbi:hypothetical protein F5Y15DRAFT_418682 [Xylariaceae sp. FL0016]|nr:hypothetical protein F5Y15DRAFT_418682 [Xylariaceae sp. FL0016]